MSSVPTGHWTPLRWLVTDLHQGARALVALRANLLRLVTQIDRQLDLVADALHQGRRQNADCPLWRKCVNAAGGAFRVDCTGCPELKED